MGSCLSKAQAGVAAAKSKAAETKAKSAERAAQAKNDVAEAVERGPRASAELKARGAGETVSDAAKSAGDGAGVAAEGVKDAAEGAKETAEGATGAVTAGVSDAAGDAKETTAEATTDAAEAADEGTKEVTKEVTKGVQFAIEDDAEATEGDTDGKESKSKSSPRRTPPKGGIVAVLPSKDGDKPATEEAPEEGSSEPVGEPSLPADGIGALMAGTLEAMRAGIAECATVAASGDARRLMIAFSDLTLAVRHEMIIEEEAYFPLLDTHFANVARTAGLYAAHKEDEKLEKAVDKSLRDASAAKKAFDAWSKHHLAHIDAELDALGAPLGELPAKLGAAAAAEMNGRVLSDRMDDLPWFAAWNANMLAKYKSFDALRDWTAALRRIATAGEWDVLRKAVLAPLPKDDRARLEEALKDVPALAE